MKTNTPIVVALGILTFGLWYLASNSKETKIEQSNDDLPKKKDAIKTTYKKVIL